MGKKHIRVYKIPQIVSIHESSFSNSKIFSCCDHFYIKWVFSLQLAGIGVLGVGLWTLLDKHEYVSVLTSQTYPVVTYVLISAGALVIIVTILGCCALSKENRAVLICVSNECLSAFQK